MTTKIFAFTSIITVILTAVMLGIVGYWIYWPVTVIEIKDNKVILEKTDYHPGERIKYSFEYCKFRDNPVTLYRSLVDGIHLTYTDVKNSLGTGCGMLNNADLIVPEFITSGTYHIAGKLEYQLNPLRKVYYNWTSDNFTISEN